MAAICGESPGSTASRMSAHARIAFSHLHDLHIEHGTRVPPIES
jgi:hypothetical protein